MIEVTMLWAQSIDGVIGVGPQHLSTSWTSPEDRQRFIKITKEAGVIVCGRSTYKTFPKQPLKGRFNVVYTNEEGLLGISPTNDLMYTNLDPDELIELLQRKYSHIVICGGAQIYDMFWRSGLVTRLEVTIEPIEFGNAPDAIRLTDNPLTQKSSFKLITNEIVNPGGTVFQSYAIGN